VFPTFYFYFHAHFFNLLTEEFMSDKGDGFFKGFLFGGIVGGIIALLYAPKSGKETRAELSEESEKMFSRLKVDLENASKAAMQAFEEHKDKIVENLTQKEDEKPPEKPQGQRKRTTRPRSRPARSKE
jgi:gas vesicle protein